jgi:hypothetical protein
VRLWPYQRGIADAISDPEIERVKLVKPEPQARRGVATLGAKAGVDYCSKKTRYPGKTGARHFLTFHRALRLRLQRLAGGNVRPALSSHLTDDCYSFGADM